jgi:O-antigen/teichoic acid export membrane protein
MLLVLGVSLYTTRIVLNALGVVDFGIINIVSSFVSMFAFLNVSMSSGIQRFYNFKLGSEGEQSLVKVFNMSLLIQVILAVVVVVFLESIGLWYLNHKMVIPMEKLATAQWIYHFSVISFVLVIIQIPYSAAIIAYERMNYFAYVSIIEVGLKLVFALWLPHVRNDRLFVYGCYTLVAQGLTFILYIAYTKYHFKSLVLQKHFHKDLFKEMLFFSGWNQLETFAYMLKNQGLNVLLNAFFGPIVNAARGVSGMIGNAISGFQNNIVISFRPQIVQSHAENNYSRVKKLMYSLSKISYIILLMLSMPIIIELPYILKLWLGDVVPHHTVSFTILILINMIISSLNTPLTQIVHATGNIKNYKIGTSLVICAILPISWLFLQAGASPEIVYIVSLCMICINQVVSCMLLKQVFDYKISEYLKTVILPCITISLLSIVLPSLVHYLMPPSFARLIIITVVSIGSTITVSYLLALNTDEKEFIAGSIKQIVRKYISYA